jgi:hypothetical protein
MDEAPSIHALPPRPHGVRRIASAAIAVGLTLLIILLPALSATISYRQTGEPPERDLVQGAMAVSGALAGLAWALFGLVRVVRRMNFMAAAATRGSGYSISTPELVRAMLADHDIACMRCGYNLRGLQGGACPGSAASQSCSASPVPTRSFPSCGSPGLPVAGYLVFVALGVLGAIRAVREWPTYSWQYPGSRMAVIKLGLALQPACTFAGLLVLGALLLAWITAEAGQARALARWRVLNVCIALLCLVGLADIAGRLLLS